MRFLSFLSVIVVLSNGSFGRADEKEVGRVIDQRLYDVLREVHNRGADLYDTGDQSGCYRIFQSTLMTSRGLLSHRPLEQKFIDAGLAAAETKTTTAGKAFALHEVISQLRMRLKPLRVDGPESLSIIPREVNPKVDSPKDPKKDPKEKEKGGSVQIIAPPTGLAGYVTWQKKPVGGVDVTLISREVEQIRVYETQTDENGAFVISRIIPGKYTVLVESTKDKKVVLPERYRSTNTSPLIIDVAKSGETITLVLQ